MFSIRTGKMPIFTSGGEVPRAQERPDPSDDHRRHPGHPPVEPGPDAHLRPRLPALRGELPGTAAFPAVRRPQGPEIPHPGEPGAHFPEPPRDHPGRPRPPDHLAPLSGHAGPRRPVPGLRHLLQQPLQRHHRSRPRAFPGLPQGVYAHGAHRRPAPPQHRDERGTGPGEPFRQCLLRRFGPGRPAVPLQAFHPGRLPAPRGNGQVHGEDVLPSPGLLRPRGRGDGAPLQRPHLLQRGRVPRRRDVLSMWKGRSISP